MRSVLLATSALLMAACASTPSTEHPTVSLVQAERDFAANGSRLTVNEAFLGVLAPDAILFRPTPVNARVSLAERPMGATLLLLWAPIFAESSTDGTLGITTGPSEYGQRPAARAGTGHFLSVWRRTPAGWQLVIDGGIDAPLTTSVAGAARELAVRGGTRTYPDDGNIRDAEANLLRDYRKYFMDWADEDARVFRNGTAPTPSKQEAISLVEREDSNTVFVPSQFVTAGSNDIAYVYGTVNPQSAKPGAYLRIYRRGPRGVWKIAYDLRP